MIVQAFRRPQFVSQCNIWTSSPVDHPFLLSFRVWRLQVLPSLPRNDPVVTLNAPAPIVNFAGQIAQAGILVVRPYNQVASLVFLNVLFDSIDVPHGLMFIWYPDMIFCGNPTVVCGPSTLVGAMPWQTQMQSFRVVVDDGQIALPPPTSIVNVTCHTANDKTLVHFGPNTTYPMLLPGFCTSLTIQPGLAVLSYDRPWLLGSFPVWNSSVVQPAVGSPVVLCQYPMRSLQVVPIDAIPVVPADEVVPPPDAGGVPPLPSEVGEKARFEEVGNRLSSVWRVEPKFSPEATEQLLTWAEAFRISCTQSAAAQQLTLSPVCSSALSPYGYTSSTLFYSVLQATPLVLSNNLIFGPHVVGIVSELARPTDGGLNSRAITHLEYEGVIVLHVPHDFGTL
ncbi:Aste57867_21241 [Aphanomyces stellatus]|uniref:Aste57867_21241 protein n=1 Tax=Aphanomyces stellatus TaxID=120398 RepID=A0A485LGZ4_9STRA|nr:hypothetical protein As57867_021173 [Aphanomyces stellatus]VFT97913.1 Aste57867_21241 [Aphanomyces stellatus]